MTYTFSRALHMMRYGGAKMKLEKWEKDNYLKVEDGIILETTDDGEEWFGTVLLSSEILGNWEEVKDKKL